jgi:hypothetical protein
MVARRGDTLTRRQTTAMSRAVRRMPALEEGSPCIPRRGGGTRRPAGLEGGVTNKKKTKFLFWADTAGEKGAIKPNLCSYAIERAAKTQPYGKTTIPATKTMEKERSKRSIHLRASPRREASVIYGDMNCW